MLNWTCNRPFTTIIFKESALNAALRASKLIPDFFQLLLAVCQGAVFDNERPGRGDSDEEDVPLLVKLAGSE